MNDSDPIAPTAGIALGAVLVVVGVAAYVLTDFASVTALIPAVFGAIIAALGVMGRRTDRRRIASYGIGLLGALGALGSLRGVPDILALLTGGEVESLVGAVAQGTTILIGVLLVAAVAKDVLDDR